MNLARYANWAGHADLFRWAGRVAQVTGLLIESEGPAAGLGDFCEIRTSTGRTLRAEVVGFRDHRVLTMPLEEMDGLRPGDLILARGSETRVVVGPGLLGRILDGFGRPLDQGPPIPAEATYGLYDPPPGPLDREPITEPLDTGIRVIDALLTCGRGQRIGVFGGSGVGKSTLLGSLARNNKADVTVIVLIGERNREVRDFLEREMSPGSLARSVVVVATSDRPAPLRVRACFVGMAIAEYFRDQGRDVLLVADSMTRLAMAQREIGLAAGEPPSQKGYTPSVFHLLPKIFERAGRFRKGSITGFFTVLVEGDDLNEPVTDAVRGILDGHIVLSRQLSGAGHYPAIDVLQSVSRLSSRVTSPRQGEAAQMLRSALAAYQASEDLIRMGAYAASTDARLDAAIRLQDPLREFLRQAPAEVSRFEETLGRMQELAVSFVQGGGKEVRK